MNVGERFLQTDPIGYKDDMDLYSYVGNDPINRTDPTGTYGRGDGFTDKQWEKFNKVQQRAANSMDKRAGKMEAKADKLDAKGKGGGDSLRAGAGNLRAGAGALRSDGSDGKIANAKDGAGYKAEGGSEFGAALVKGNGPIMIVNMGNPVWTARGVDSTQLEWSVGHESLHTAGLGHGKLSDGTIGYKFGSPEQQSAFKSMPTGTPEGDSNPDSLMQDVYPNF